ncbi:hypothetical protein [Longimicrobium sp.]|uniref:hypothetical protein n=1 Tax=Longimicrobium sp. TaxID=2029185 RepID=UPI003B3AC924
MLGFDNADLLIPLLWAQVLLVWAAANYLPNNDPAGHQELEVMREHHLLIRWKRQVWGRGVAAGGVVALLPGAADGGWVGRVALAVLMLAGCVLLPLIRIRLAERRNRHRRHFQGTPALRVQRGVWLAEWEIGSNALMAAAAWLVISRNALKVQPWFHLPLQTRQLVCVTAFAAIMLFVTRGGAFVVRGVLNKVGALPLTSRKPDEEIDLVEFNRGRIIGVLERFIVLLLMAVQAYQAIAFLMAAKGLIRSKDLESRDFAEYFLIGTLASMGLALICGIMVQLLLRQPP